MTGQAQQPKQEVKFPQQTKEELDKREQGTNCDECGDFISFSNGEVIYVVDSSSGKGVCEKCHNRRMNPTQEGKKHDGGKTRYGLVPHEAEELVAQVLTHGATKYDDRNWEKGINYERCYSAARRHMKKWWGEESIDPEFGITHLAHAAANLFFLMAFEARKMDKFDDRPRKNQ